MSELGSSRGKWPVSTAIGLMTLMSMAIGGYAIAFQLRLTGNPEFHFRFDEMYISSTMHVIGGGIVLLLGGLQFSSTLRMRYTQWHRWAGRVYLSFVLIGGTGGLLLAPHADGGLVAKFGFGTLAVFWLFSGVMAYVAIRQGQVATHKIWMMRNYAMAFGAVTLRIYLGLFELVDVPFADSYPVTAWISWVPNLILVEWFLVQNLPLQSERKSA